MVDVTHSNRQRSQRRIVVSSPGQRARARSSARRNSGFIATLRILFPLVTLVLLASYFLIVQMNTKIEDDTHRGRFSISSADLLATKPTMRNPTYAGYNKKDGSEYTIRADRAVTDLDETKPIDLFGIEADVKQQDGTTFKVTAKNGQFDRRQNKLELFDEIIVSSREMQANLSRATVFPSQSLIQSDQPVAMRFPAGELDGNKLYIEQKKNKFRLYDGVKARLYSHNSAASKQPEASSELGIEPVKASNGLASFAAKSDRPVDITSRDLLAHTHRQLAVFSGDVTVTQDNAKLTADTMDIAYKAANSTGAAADVHKIVARNNVVIARDENRAVTELAIFDTEKNTAELIGRVVLSSGTDRTIKGDKALLYGDKDSMVLTGQVIVEQGENVLRGTRLDYDRRQGKMSLTDPKSGRIKAEFVRQNVAASKTAPRADTVALAAGNPTDGLFKTDPNSRVKVESNRLDVDDVKRQATFKGNVYVRQGQFTIRTAIVHANYSGSSHLTAGPLAADAPAVQGRQPAQLTSIHAPQHVVVETDNGQYASGQSGEFDFERNEIYLIGNVVLRQGRQLVRGERLVVDLTSGLSRIEKNKSNDRNSKIEGQQGAAKAKSETSDQANDEQNAYNSKVCGGRMCATFFPDDIRNSKQADRLQKNVAPSDDKRQINDQNLLGAATGWSVLPPSGPQTSQSNR